MRQETKTKRQNEIAVAAYRVLEKKGYSGASMLAIARQAKASNETLYNWYGDKAGLLGALVEHNAADVKALLVDSISSGDNAVQTLEVLGPVLLSVLLGSRAVALNRAAAADPTGELGATIALQGRETVVPLVLEVLCRGRDQGYFSFDDTDEVLEVYLGLLIGDLQIRRVIGRMPEPDKAFIALKSRKALLHLQKLYGKRGAA